MGDDLAAGGYPWWSIGLVVSALRGCPETLLLLLGGQAAIIGLGVVCARARVSPPKTLLALLALSGVFAWLARDQNYLLGDSRLWIRHATLLGEHLPAYRAPLSALVLGWISRLGGRVAPVPDVLAAVSVLAGIGTALIVWLMARRETRGDRWLPVVVTTSVFCVPLSFVFYGHAESYPFFLLLLALFLALLRFGFQKRSLLLGAAAVYPALCLTHFSAVLIVIPVAATMVGGWKGSWVRVVLVYVALLAAVWALAATVPVVKDHSLLARPWSRSDFADYLWDVGNLWVLLFFPLGGLALGLWKRVVVDGFGRILGLLVVTYALFPLLAYFELGGYRDLDLLGPALVTLSTFCVIGVARGGLPKESVPFFLVGSMMLGGLQTLAICPEGAKELAKHLGPGAMAPEGRAGGEEVLAFYYKERGDLGPAALHMKRATEVMPGNKRLWGPLGEIQLEMGDTVQAVASLEMAMKSPRAERTAPLLGELLLRRGETRRAVDLLESHRDVVLYDGRGAAALAVGYFQIGEPESALSVAEERIAIQPADDVAYFNAAAAYTRLGNLRRASLALARAAQLNPEKLTYHIQLVKVLLQLPDGDEEARRYLESLDPALAETISARLGL